MLLFEESAQFWHIWAVLIQYFEQKCNGLLDQSKTLHIQCQNLNCTWAGIIYYGLSHAFQRWWYKQKKEWLFCSLYYHLPDLMCYILLHSFHISTNFKVFPFKWYQYYAYPCFRAWATDSQIWVCHLRGLRSLKDLHLALWYLVR
jgi:hypothetical protein